MKKVALFLALVLLLTGCAGNQTAGERVTAMGTQMEWAVSGKDADAAVATIKTLVEEMEAEWSPMNINSIPSQLNDSGAVLNMDHIRFLDELTAIGQRTHGAYSPQIHALLALWGFVDGKHQVPSQEQVRDALLEEQWNVAAVMKGYTARKAVTLLETMQVDRAILYLGSTVQTFGADQSWEIAIPNPAGGEALGQVAVNGTWAISTAGGYQRGFENNGKWYHYLLDPRTGMPAESDLAAVTVICKDAVLADAMATALFVMGMEEAISLWQGSEDFEAVFILADGSVRVTAGVEFSGADATRIEK